MPTTAREPRDELVTEVADLLHHVNHLIRRQAQAEAGPHGPTGAQMRALRVLSRSEEPLRMSELAAALGIARRSATSVVDDLEVSALVERVEDHMDRRAVRVQLTHRGRSTMADARQRREHAAAQLFSALTVAELSSVRSLLSRARDGR